MLFIFGVIALSVCFPHVQAKAAAEKPNIVFFLTDDQDQMLGASFPIHDGVTPMPRTLAGLAEQGVTATNFFIHTPICCPSRSEVVTGRYFHNIKQTGKTGACMHVNLTEVNANTFARNLQDAGYTVGLFGKYLNDVPAEVPPGFDAWLANGGGTYIGPQFATKGITGLPDGSWKGTSANYSTAVIGNVSTTWIREVAAKDKPFFAYIAPKAAHEPFIPAPWYVEHWDEAWPAHEPRPENWNASIASRTDHHGVIATEDLLTEQASTVITGIFKNRWRTLMSVDDVIGAVLDLCEELHLMDNTYFFYSSDHGFQLGEFNILMDKRQVYDTNTRIHLLARGPGIAPNSQLALPATQVDLAPTWLGLAGLDKPANMDGKSLLPLIMDYSESSILPVTTQHLQTLGDSAAYAADWRDNVLIEYYYVAENVKCVKNCTQKNKWPHGDSYCTDLPNNTDCWGPACTQNCYPTESTANNYIALRSMEGSEFGDTLYVEYMTGDQNTEDVDFSTVDFVEYYDAASDPWQITNLRDSADSSVLGALHAKVHQWFKCQGDECP